MDPDSKVLAWQLSVAIELAKLCDQVIVLTNRVANFQCPTNMTVHLFPKVLYRAPIRWLGGLWWINFFVWYLCKKYKIKACFIHMNMEWSYRLAPVFWLCRIPVLLWYAHGTVTNKLKRAHKYATRIVTSTPEGFRLPSNKLSIIGQGVDTSIFTIESRVANVQDIISVGRISPRKQVDRMVDVMEALAEIAPQIPFRLIIIGDALTSEDRIYQQQIYTRLSKSVVAQQILFVGHIQMANIPVYYSGSFLHLNLSLTGSMDKTVMEALAAGCPVLTSNEAFHDILQDFPQYIIRNNDRKAIAQQILTIYNNQNNINRSALRDLVLNKHDLATYPQRILEELKKIKK